MEKSARKRKDATSIDSYQSSAPNPNGPADDWLNNLLANAERAEPTSQEQAGGPPAHELLERRDEIGQNILSSGVEVSGVILQDGPTEQEQPESQVQKPEVKRGRGPGRPRKEGPLIGLEQIREVVAELNEPHEIIRRRFQELLDSLAGGRGKTSEEDKKIAKSIADLAELYGLRLTVNGKIISFYWNGAYVAQATTGDKDVVDTNAIFLPLKSEVRKTPQLLNLQSDTNRGR